ncbi:hypothetical protein M6B38_140050 [Iris pallida]|uniref:Uncharacterized protein n=1 Tax=Iris pallida TaxID=29817 RepID=A0AAX6FDA9_IRIPA|nr:hypothetical protein M6B38_140050 [Iris pallida]
MIILDYYGLQFFILFMSTCSDRARRLQQTKTKDDEEPCTLYYGACLDDTYDLDPRKVLAAAEDVTHA